MYIGPSTRYYISIEQNQPIMTYLDRLELIDFIVVETDRETEGDFEEDMLRDQLEAATDTEVQQMAEIYGW